MPNVNLFNFMSLQVKYGEVLFFSVNELQKNSTASSKEEHISKILIIFLEIHHVYIWALQVFVFCLSVLNNG